MNYALTFVAGGAAAIALLIAWVVSSVSIDRDYRGERRQPRL